MLELLVCCDLVLGTQTFLIASVHRRSRKRQAEIYRNDEEFQIFMSLELDPEERQWINALYAA